MSYKIAFDRPAEKAFRRLPAEMRQAFASRISALAENPHPPESRKLEGTDDCYRLRQGDYRVVCTILEDHVVVLILRVGHRGDVYRGIPDLSVFRDLRVGAQVSGWPAELRTQPGNPETRKLCGERRSRSIERQAFT